MFEHIARNLGDTIPDEPPESAVRTYKSFRQILFEVSVENGTLRIPGTVFISSSKCLKKIWHELVRRLGENNYDIACYTSPLQQLREAPCKYFMNLTEDPLVVDLKPGMRISKFCYATVREDVTYVWFTLIIPENRYVIDEVSADYNRVIELHTFVRVEQSHNEPTYIYGLFRIRHLHWYYMGIVRMLRTMVHQLTYCEPSHLKVTLHRDELELIPYIK